MTGPTALSDEQFARLRRLLSSLAGLVFDEHRRQALAFGVAERLRASGVPDVDRYLDLLHEPASPERQALLDEVTIQETHFFRNPPQMRALRSRVLPELVREAGATAGRRLRLWSAGCSTGEEPYTLAMILLELLPSLDGWDVEVVGTDVSERALQAARQGVYGPRAVQLAGAEQRARFFLPREDGRYEVRPEVRSLVRFRHHNLVTEPPVADRLDLVLCRNVTIYFDRDTTRTLVGRLHGALRDGGYLLLGHAETLWRVSDAFRLVSVDTGAGAAFVYRRVDAPAAGAAPGRAPRLAPPAAGLPRLAPPAAAVPRQRATAPGDPPRRGTPLPGLPAPPSRVPAAGGPAERPDGPEPDVDPDPLHAARAALAEGRYSEAAALAAAVADTEPLRGAAHRLRGDALVAAGDDAGALVALRRALYLDPADALGHFQLAGALARCGDPAAGAREYAAAAALLAARPAGPAPELGGRTVGELVALCCRLGAGAVAGAAS